MLSCVSRVQTLPWCSEADLRLRAWSIREKAASGSYPPLPATGTPLVAGWATPTGPTWTRDFGVSTPQLSPSFTDAMHPPEAAAPPRRAQVAGRRSNATLSWRPCVCLHTSQHMPASHGCLLVRHLQIEVLWCCISMRARCLLLPLSP